MPGRRLKRDERESIRVGLVQGLSLRCIGQRLGRSTSTIAREVTRNGDRVTYRAFEADRRAHTQALRPKCYKLERHPALAALVAELLRKKWSPCQISGRLRVMYPTDPSMRVSHETIYQSLFVQGRGGLRKELTDALRTGRAHRRSRTERDKSVGHVARGVMISDRPAEVEDRAVPGHWEGDLIIGKEGKSQVGTLVERTSRLLILVRLPKDRTAATVRQALQHHIKWLPKALKESVTWDQGKEMAEHASFRIATDMDVYFCEPHSPWQRGTNENTNGLIRQYLPKGMDLSTLTAKQLRRISRELNERPRKTLNWMTPAEKFAELVATAC